MARYTVHVKIKHDHLGDGPSDLVVTMRGDKKILQDVENYALHYEEMSKSLATAEAERDQAIREIGRIGRYLGTTQAERDELQRRCESYKSAYDAILADLRIMEQKLNDLQVENSRLIRIGEERHIRAKDTEEGLMEHVERLQEENERLRKALEKIVSYCSDRHRVMMLGVQGFSTINEIAKAALREVDGGKD